MFPLAIRRAISVCVLPLVLLSSISAIAHSAVEPVPREDEGWQKRQQMLNQRVLDAGKNAKLVFIGDSITEAWEKEGKDVWAKYYGARNAINLGMGGDETQHILWRLDHGNLEGMHPKLVVLLIGTNNVYFGNSVSQTADGVAAVVQKLRDKLPETRVLLVAIFPRGENPNPSRGEVLQIDQIIRQLVDNEHVFWADFGYCYVDKNGLIPGALMWDYLHLTAKGYEVWAESIEEQVSTILGDSRIR